MKQRASRARKRGPASLRDRQILERWFLAYRLTEEVERCRRYGRPLAVVAAAPQLLDGERPSPEALAAVVEAATNVTRTTDLLGWGGDDRILIVMPETTFADARTAASRWQNEIWQRSRTVAVQEWKLAVLSDPDDFATIETLHETLLAKPEGQISENDEDMAPAGETDGKVASPPAPEIPARLNQAVSADRPAFLGAAIASAVAAFCFTLLGLSAIAACLVAATAFCIAAARFAKSPWRGSVSPSALVNKAIEQAASGRRLAIYERETGLFAHWYLTLRGEEECARAARYGRPLALVLFEPVDGATAWTTKDTLTSWLGRQLRASDVVGYVGNCRFVALMPETTGSAVAQTVARLRDDVAATVVSAAYYPLDGVTFEQLYECARRRLSDEEEAVA